MDVVIKLVFSGELCDAIMTRLVLFYYTMQGAVSGMHLVKKICRLKEETA